MVQVEKRSLFCHKSDHGSSRSLVSNEQGWVYVNGVVFSSYCYIVLLIMSFFFLLSGVLFTAISYRPQEVGEKFGEWSFRLAQSRNTKIAGPAFIVLGFIMTAASILLCQVSRRVTSSQPILKHQLLMSAGEENDLRHETQRRLKTNMVAAFPEEGNKQGSGSYSSQLIVSDIACFPDTNTPRSTRLLAIQSSARASVQLA